METEFKLFDPKISTMDELPDKPGNYFIVLRVNCQLPSIGITPIYHKWNYENVKYDIIYTGISNQSLRVRDYKQHFTGNNAGRSTLRKSLGSMMGFFKPKSVIRISQCCMAMRSPLISPRWTGKTALFLKTLPDRGYACPLFCPNKPVLRLTRIG